MDDLLNQIGQRIRKHRERSRLSQEQLAERIDVSSQTISTAETGKKRLRVENIIKICRIVFLTIEVNNTEEILVNHLEHKIKRYFFIQQLPTARCIPYL